MSDFRDELFNRQMVLVSNDLVLLHKHLCDARDLIRPFYDGRLSSVLEMLELLERCELELAQRLPYFRSGNKQEAV